MVPIPMTQTPTLIEPSFAEAIAIIAAAPELPEQKRRHWTTSLRQIAKALDKPLEVIPARYSAVRADLAQLHQAPAGLTAKTLQNHKSNTKSALLWLAREKGISEHGAPLTPAWEELRGKSAMALPGRKLSSHAVLFGQRHRAGRGGRGRGRPLHGLSRSDRKACRQCIPASAGPGVERKCRDHPGLAGAPAHRAAAQGCRGAAMGGVPRRSAAGSWTNILKSLTHVRRGRTGKRIRPLKPSTIRQRRVELLAAARMAVKEGVPIDSLTSLSALLAPEVAEKVLDAYWRRNGENPQAVHDRFGLQVPRDRERNQMPG